jgi:type 1 fimbriae regulatory protein FimB/type 1 fimbriae regulatory protein FimE
VTKRVTEGGRPTTVNGKVPPRRRSNAERRPREYLTPEEVELLITTARKRIGARTPHRDATMILLAYRHGLRASELCSLRWDMLDLGQGRYHVTRRKNGRPSVHLLRGTEIRALRRLQREQVPQSVYVFTSERRGPMTPATFRKLLAVIGAAAGLTFPVHPHMLRHACGYKLAHDGHDTRALQEWLGHANIQNTTRYTELTSQRFKDFWQREDQALSPKGVTAG